MSTEHLAGPGVAVVGSQRFRDRAVVRRVIGRIKAKHPYAVIHTGDAPGADTLTIEECSALGVPCISHKAQWRRSDGSFDRAAGHKRNPDIVNPCSALVALFADGPKTPGTSGSVRIAIRNGIPVYEYHEGRWTTILPEPCELHGDLCPGDISDTP